MKIKFFKSISFALLVSLTCANYSNAGNNPIPDNTEDTITAVEIAMVRNELIGRWENPYFEYKNANGSLKFHFRQDGTFTKELGGAEMLLREEGTWEISDDGKHLLMRTQSLCNGQSATVTQVATIKHLNFDELVLEQKICVDGVAISAEPESFYFNKY